MDNGLLKRKVIEHYGSIKNFQEQEYPEKDLNGMRIGIRKPLKKWVVDCWYKHGLISASECREQLYWLDKQGE